MVPGAGGDSEALASALTFLHVSPSPTSVLHVQTFCVPSAPSADEVVVQMLAAPINPQDFLITAGLYPIKPVHRVNDEPVPGYDGVGRVFRVGSQVASLRVGDLVIPRSQGFGTWRTHAVVAAHECAKVPHCSDVRFAAILKMTILPAYFLVEDLCHLRPGSWIVQNAGTSSIAQMVSQFARLKGAQTINIIRDSLPENRDADNKAKQMILDKGANVVCTESEFEAEGDTILRGKRVVLALDCVWGKAAETLAARLPPNATLVNFANLSGGGPKVTAALPHSSLFGASMTFRGWKSTSSLATRSDEEFDDLTAWLVGLLEDGTLKMPSYRSAAWAPDAGLRTAGGPGESLEHELLEVVRGAHGPEMRKQKVLFEFRK